MDFHNKLDTGDLRVDANGERKHTPGWKALLNFTSRRHAATLVFALIFATVSGIIVPILAILFGRIFETFTKYGGGNIDGDELTSEISTYATAIVVLGGATWLLNSMHCTAWMAFGTLQAKEIREQLFQDLLDKKVGWYETHTSGIGALLPRLQTWV